MTLIEILIVLLIMASALGVATLSIRNLSNAELKGAALRLSGTITYIYGRAAINGMRYQLVIDLDENAFWAECSEQEIALPQELVSANSLDATGRADLRFQDDDPEADPFGLNLARSFEDCSEPLIEHRTLPSGIVFDSVMTAHQVEPFEEGQTSIAFFSNGFVEPSMIWLREEDGETGITLSINPMNGQVTIETGLADVPDDFHQVEEDR